jgi:hypothetical protein
VKTIEKALISNAPPIERFNVARMPKAKLASTTNLNPPLHFFTQSIFLLATFYDRLLYVLNVIFKVMY